MDRWEVDGVEAQSHLAEAAETIAALIADSGLDLGTR